ncbi:MAG: radical SAM protein [Candidatus Geothermincolia bacterium]
MLDRYTRIGEMERPAVNWLSRCVPAGLEDVSAVATDDLWSANSEGIAAVRAMLENPLDPSAQAVSPNLLDVKVELARRMLDSCVCCERRCRVDRAHGEHGFCGVGAASRYSSDFLHMGEEPELVPSHTIFFSGCTFECVYCQNWDIAIDPRAGRLAEPEMLAAVLQEGLSQGSRNANFVGGNPDPHLWTILQTIKLAGESARFLPMVWNSNMFTSIEALRLLDGVIDVYLGDFRYGSDACASELSGVEGYFEVVSRNFSYAFDSAEVMVRHLVLPNHIECCTRPVLEWVSRNMPGVYFNLMFQYRPEYKAGLFPTIDRRLTPEDRSRAMALAAEYGLESFG